ncbi:MAG: Flp pilus assembly protein CpaB [Hyphomonadaceae bacterium]|nr:Flp pilus assembly protein CpaB [Hyphomonadaceae bacterium]
MMKYLPAISLGLSLVLGIAAYFLLRGGPEVSSTPVAATVQVVEPVVEPKTVNVLVLKEEIEGGMPVTPDLVRSRDWPAEHVPDGALTNTTSLYGTNGAPLLAQMNMISGELLVAEKLGELPPRRMLSKSIPVGYRAVSIAVTTETGVAGFVLPGDRVDINAFIAVPGGRGPDAFRTRPLLGNVLVLGIDQIMGSQVEGAMPSSLVTLALEPEDAQRVTAASRESRLGLALIGQEELEKEEEETPEAQRPRPVITPVVRRAPQPARPSTARVTVVHGTNAETVTAPVDEGEPMQIGIAQTGAGS